VWVKGITAILCTLMNHHTVGQRCLEGKASYNTKWLASQYLITTDYSLA